MANQPSTNQPPVILITGASSGIGAAAARRLGREGVRLTLAARRTDRLQQVAEEVEKAGSQVLLVPTDVTNPSDIQSMLQTTLDHWGRIDVLVNNAGIAQDMPSLVDMPADKIRAEVLTNLLAPIECARAVLPTMLRQKSGHIINVGSINALIATPENTIYCATKFGIFGFSDALRRSLRGSGIHVSVFCPGYTPSEINERLKAHVEGRPDAPYHPMLMPTSEVADRLAWLVYHPRRVMIIPFAYRPLIILAFLFPGLADVLVTQFRPK